MKRYIRSSVGSKNIEYKKKYINDIIKKIRNGSASPSETATAVDMITWLWKWKHIDEATKNDLCDRITNAMAGIEDEADWNDESNYFN